MLQNLRETWQGGKEMTKDQMRQTLQEACHCMGLFLSPMTINAMALALSQQNAAKNRKTVKTEDVNSTSTPNPVLAQTEAATAHCDQPAIVTAAKLADLLNTEDSTKGLNTNSQIFLNSSSKQVVTEELLTEDKVLQQIETYLDPRNVKSSKVPETPPTEPTDEIVKSSSHTGKSVGAYLEKSSTTMLSASPANARRPSWTERLKKGIHLLHHFADTNGACHGPGGEVGSRRSSNASNCHPVYHRQNRRRGSNESIINQHSPVTQAYGTGGEWCWDDLDLNIDALVDEELARERADSHRHRSMQKLNSTRRCFSNQSFDIGPDKNNLIPVAAVGDEVQHSKPPSGRNGRSRRSKSDLPAFLVSKISGGSQGSNSDHQNMAAKTHTRNFDLTSPVVPEAGGLRGADSLSSTIASRPARYVASVRETLQGASSLHPPSGIDCSFEHSVAGQVILESPTVSPTYTNHSHQSQQQQQQQQGQLSMGNGGNERGPSPQLPNHFNFDTWNDRQQTSPQQGGRATFAIPNEPLGAAAAAGIVEEESSADFSPRNFTTDNEDSPSGASRSPSRAARAATSPTLSPARSAHSPANGGLDAPTVAFAAPAGTKTLNTPGADKSVPPPVSYQPSNHRLRKRHLFACVNTIDVALVIWALIAAIITGLYYGLHPELTAVFGDGLIFARGSATVIMHFVGVAFLLMSRLTLTWIRGWRILKYLPRFFSDLLDAHRSAHITCGLIIMFFAAVHVIAHLGGTLRSLSQVTGSNVGRNLIPPLPKLHSMLILSALLVVE